MQTLKTALAVTALVALAGCSIDGPRVRLHPPVKVEVEGDGHHHRDGGGGGFCPPGQAKKGNC